MKKLVAKLPLYFLGFIFLFLFQQPVCLAGVAADGGAEPNLIRNGGTATKEALSGGTATKEARVESPQGHFDPPRILLNPASKEEYAAKNRRFTGIPSIAVSPSGRLWATWYAGITPAEDQNNYVVLATSDDMGETWTPVIPSGIQHPSARFFIQRLHSGNLLLVKHGPIDMRTGRSHLMAFISRDDGHSWSDGFLLDQRDRVSYPDAQQASDGTIFVVYDFFRRGDQQILMMTFSEDDVLSGSSRRMVEAHQRRRIVSEGGQ